MFIIFAEEALNMVADEKTPKRSSAQIRRDLAEAKAAKLKAKVMNCLTP